MSDNLIMLREKDGVWVRYVLRNCGLDITPGEIEIGNTWGNERMWVKDTDVIRSWYISGICDGYSIENVTLPPPTGRRYPHPGFSMRASFPIMKNLRRCQPNYRDEEIPT